MNKLLLLPLLLSVSACTAGRGYIDPVTKEAKQAPFREAFDSTSIIAEQSLVRNQLLSEIVQILKRFEGTD